MAFFAAYDWVGGITLVGPNDLVYLGDVSQSWAKCNNK